VNRPSPTSTASEHAPPVAPSPSASSVKAVQASWAKAENIGLRVVGELFFKELFEASPAAKELFTAQKFGEDAAGQRRFKAHTLNVMQTLSAAVYGLSDLSALARTLPAPTYAILSLSFTLITFTSLSLTPLIYHTLTLKGARARNSGRAAPWIRRPT